MAGLYSKTTRASGITLTANIYNTDHQNHIDNHDPEQMDDYSPDAATMKTSTDPGDVGSESLATTMAGEIERIRFVLDAIIGGAEWYTDPAATIAALNTSVASFSAKDSDDTIIHHRVFN